MAIEFRLDEHSVRGAPVKVCEVWVDGNMVGTIYPNVTGNGVKMLSRHVSGADTREIGEVIEFNVEFEFRGPPEEPPQKGQ